VAREPEPIDRAVKEEWVEVIDPIAAWIRLGLRGERNGACRGECDKNDG